MPSYGRKSSNQSPRISGKTVIITGCNTGIGKEIMIDLYKIGVHVVMACRNLDKAQLARDEVIKEHKYKKGVGSINIVRLELGSLALVRECAEKILKTEPKIHLLINNAGVMMCPEGTTEDGFEIQFGTNHLGHFLFTILLLPRLIKSKPARIITVSSVAHERGSINFEDVHFLCRKYSAIDAYCQSKLANLLFSKELSKKLKHNLVEDVNTYAIHPGIVYTDLIRHLDESVCVGSQKLLSVFKWFFKTPREGAQAVVFCAIDEDLVNQSGLYYSNCSVRETGSDIDDAVCKKLWDISWKMVGLNDFNPFDPDLQ